VKKIWLVSISAICLSFIGCKGSAKIYPVDFVDRSAVFALDKKPNPLLLVVEITEDGKLSLNKIETGMISDLTVLSEKLEVIFDDREKAGINEREVVIDPQSNVKNEDLEKVIKSLAGVKAAPIRIIKNNL
jgi:biopolymer transport protein ExbD